MPKPAAVYTWRIGDRVVARQRGQHRKVWLITGIADLPTGTVKLLQVRAEELTAQKAGLTRTFRSDAVRLA